MGESPLCSFLLGQAAKGEGPWVYTSPGVRMVLLPILIHTLNSCEPWHLRPWVNDLFTSLHLSFPIYRMEVINRDISQPSLPIHLGRVKYRRGGLGPARPSLPKLPDALGELGGDRSPLKVGCVSLN